MAFSKDAFQQHIKRFDLFHDRAMDMIFSHSGRVQADFMISLGMMTTPMVIGHPPLNHLCINMMRMIETGLLPVKTGKFSSLGLAVTTDEDGDARMESLYEKLTRGEKITDYEIEKLKLTQGVLCIPMTWPMLFKDDPVWGLTAIVFVAAQAAEVYHGRSLPIEAFSNTWPFGEAAQAELLLYLLRNGVDINLNPVKRDLLERYPNGLDSLPERHRFRLDPVMPNDFLLIDFLHKIKEGTAKPEDFQQFAALNTDLIPEDTRKLLESDDFRRFFMEGKASESAEPEG